MTSPLDAIEAAQIESLSRLRRGGTDRDLLLQLLDADVGIAHIFACTGQLAQSL